MCCGFISGLGKILGVVAASIVAWTHGDYINADIILLTFEAQVLEAINFMLRTLMTWTHSSITLIKYQTCRIWDLWYYQK